MESMTSDGGAPQNGVTGDAAPAPDAVDAPEVAPDTAPDASPTPEAPDADALQSMDLDALVEVTVNGEKQSVPLREALDAFVNKTQQHVTGTVRVKLYKGNCVVAGRRSEYSIYDEDIVTFEEDCVYNQADAEGFIKLNALRLRMLANSKQRRS